jgi:prepilin-type N-terminal cleavage/methylation domain-containing protein
MIRSDSRSRGFTLIELLVVMSIIATLAGLAIVGVPYYIRQAHKTKCAANLAEIYKLMMIYQDNHRTMPTADGAAFVLAIWGDPLDKAEKEAELFFCPSTGNRPDAELSNVTPEGIDYTGPDQTSKAAGRNKLSTAMAGASGIPIICNKLPDPGDMQTVEDRQRNLPHAGKGFNVLYLNGSVEWVESNKFPDDLPVIGPESPIEKFQGLKSGFDG